MNKWIPILCVLLLTGGRLAAQGPDTPVTPQDVMRILERDAAPATPDSAEPAEPVDRGSPKPAPRPEDPEATESTNAVPVTYDGPRDPFWPVGYVPVPEEEEQGEKKEIKVIARPRENWPKLVLRGIVRHGHDKHFAMLDKIGLVQPGDVVRIQQQGLIYEWKIQAISETGVSYIKLGARLKDGSLPGKGGPE